MMDSGLRNFQSCCRLCLTEKLDTSKSIFDETVEDRALPQKILQFVGIEINTTDKLSTAVCSPCITKVIGFHTYKDQCTQNQTMLQDWLTRSIQPAQMNGIADGSFQIKEEPMDDADEINSSSETPDSRVEMIVQVKNEPVDHNDESMGESMEEEYNELPPALTPHLLDPDQQQNGVAVDIHKQCGVCNKLFSSVGNRKKHEKKMHGLYQSEPQGAPPQAVNGFPEQEECTEATAVAVPSTIDEAELQKIQFAAGLKLLQTNSTPISCESLSKIELSYIEKCKAMVHMHQTLICACHNVPHQNLKGLLSHLRALRIWFPVFTCYNCMITFTDRSTFTKHIVRCPCQSLDNITKLSNLRKRSEVKTRLYQNFKCTICKFMFSFHEDFCRHVDEEHSNSSLAFPFTCHCRRIFDNLEDYKDHVYVSCMVDYYCDICFITTKTLDDFQRHASDIHDNSEGFILLQDDNYKMRKPLMHVPAKEEPKESVILSGKRERRASVRASIIETDVEESPAKVINPAILSPKANNRKCPICFKEYSSYKNMMRHYKIHSAQKPETGKEEEEEEEAFYSCPDCGGMYNNTEWQNHLLEKHEPKACGECGKSFQFQTELEQHRSVHLNLKVYRDSKTQSYRSTVISPGADEEQMLTCDVCDLIAASKEELEDHKLSHEQESLDASAEPSTNDKKRKCDLCDKEFLTYSGLWDHNKRMHPERKTPNSNTYPKKCEFCDKVCTTGAAMHRHKLIHTKIDSNISEAEKKNDSDAEEESYHTCKRCFKVFSSKYNLKNHMKCHGISTSPTAKKVVRKPSCNVCQQVFNTTEEVVNHKEECHNNDEPPVLSIENGGSAPFVFTCDVCVMTFSSKMALKKHKEKHVQETRVSNQRQGNSCKYCKLPFDSIVALAKHMQQEHDEGGKPKVGKLRVEPERHVCTVCRKTFQTAAALTTHIGWHKRGQNDMNVKLMKENKVINKLAQSAQIKQEPIEEPKFRCATCLADLPNDTALQVHILEKHRSVSAIMLIPRCNTCNKDFSTQDEYETHKRLHDFLERQKQHEQNMLLQQQERGQVPPPKVMEQNKVAGQGQQRQSIPGTPPKYAKNFPCKYCTAGFSRSDTLGAHVRQYHKEYVQTEFKCNQCDRTFDKQNSLTIHLKVHEKQRVVTTPPTKTALFSCSICSMGFDLPKDLRAHTINAHPF